MEYKACPGGFQSNCTTISCALKNHDAHAALIKSKSLGVEPRNHFFFFNSLSDSKVEPSLRATDLDFGLMFEIIELFQTGKFYLFLFVFMDFKNYVCFTILGLS